ncbi:MAG: hypothetical protein B7Z74_06430, partial [Deltaproteobacteria bacterium 21-66-5]
MDRPDPLDAAGRDRVEGITPDAPGDQRRRYRRPHQPRARAVARRSACRGPRNRPGVFEPRV